ncbi:MAG: hypothetical protein KJ626_03375 [Verrucomicrobia bacterium]|nr:hypothetical protein [Verrucomicrobiota bacterium]
MSGLRRSLLSLFASFVLFVGLPISVHGVTSYVDHAASGLNNGSSWANAYTNLQQALAFANGGDQVWVAQGTYYPDEGPFQVNDDVDSTFLINEDIEVYGGFDNLDTQLSDRDIFSNPTILSGDLGQDDADTNGDGIPNSVSGISGPNAIAAVTLGSAALTAVLDSFYVAGCEGGPGSGIRCFSAGSPLIETCQIRVNKSSSGGAGLHIEGGSPVVRDCQFQQSENDIGGILFATNANLTLLDTRIYTSSSGTGSGGLRVFATGKSVILSNCLFQGNSTVTDGGGARIQGGHVRAVNTSFRGNQANNGGGISLMNATSMFVNCLFTGNKAGLQGGAVQHVSGATSTVINCTFADNDANIWGAVSGTSNSFVNTIVWGNGQSFTPGLPDVNHTLNEFASCLIENADLSGSNNNLDGTTGFNDPLYLSPSQNPAPATDGNYSLQPISPCVEAGDDSLYSGPPQDNVGGARFLDYAFDDDSDPTIDMGALEFTFNVFFDSDNDDLPDIWELANTQPPGTGVHSGTNDVDMDGRPGLLEFAGGTDPGASNPPPHLVLSLGPLGVPQMNHTRSRFATNYLDLVLEETADLTDGAGWTTGSVSQTVLNTGSPDQAIIISTVVSPALERRDNCYRLNVILK